MCASCSGKPVAIRVVLAVLSAAGVLCTVSPGRAAQPPDADLAGVTQRLQQGEPLVFATFGDSITWPCFHTDFRQNYITLTVSALRKAYPRANVRIVHGGNFGSAARSLADDRFQRYFLEQQPDVLFLMFGMNDCAGGADGLDGLDRNLSQLIAQARAAGAVPVVLTQNEILYDSPDGARRTALPQYMQRALQVAQREQALAVDCHAAWLPLAGDRGALIARLNDWIHPNLAGHRLFAESIIAALWPEAAKYVETSVRPPPPPPPSAVAAPCLLPGPEGKQVVRHADGTWFAVSGRRRGERISDLVVSVSTVAQPQWVDFKHVTLIGPEQDALFADDDRDITAAMLLLRDSTLFVIYSWNTGVYELSIDLSRSDWQDRIGAAAAWKDFDSDPFLRPATILLSKLGNGLLFDATADRTATVLLCRDRLLAPGSGWEVIDGEDGISLIVETPGTSQLQADFVFPAFEFARAGMSASGNILLIGQKTPAGPVTVGQFGGERQPLLLSGTYRLSMPHIAGQGFAVATPEPGVNGPVASPPLAILWTTAADASVHKINSVAASQAAFPAVHGGSPALIVVDRTEDGAAPAIAYESSPAPGAASVGAVLDRGARLEFRLLPLRLFSTAD